MALATGLALAILLPPALSPATPVRVVLPPIQDSRSLAAGDTVTPLVALFLRDRLTECPSTRVVSDARAGAMLSELTLGVRDRPDTTLVPALAERLPVDAVVCVTYSDAALHLAVHLADRIERRTYPGIHPGQRQRTVLDLAGELGRLLGLSPEEISTLSEARIENDAVFHATYFTQVMSSKWPRNSAEPRLRLLRPLFTSHPNNVRLAARIVEDATALLGATRRDQEFATKGVAMAVHALPVVLGTPMEHTAFPMVTAQPEAFEADLLAIAGPVTVDAMGAAAGDLFDLEAEDDDPLGPGLDVGAIDRVGKATRPQRLGALRVLGALPSDEGLALIREAADSEKADVREAAAAALGQREDAEATSRLTRLAADTDLDVAFTAARALWRRDGPAAPALALARRVLARPGPRHRAAAADLLCAAGDATDDARLSACADDVDPAIRRSGLLGRIRLGTLDATAYLAATDNADEQVVLAALPRAPLPMPDTVRQKFLQLANDPLPEVSQAARLALQPARPTDPAAAAQFDLAIEHPYVRQQLIDRLLEQGTASALDDVAAQCRNLNPYTRAYALERLAALDPERARPWLLAALKDPYRWPRLGAAQLLAERATATDATAVRAALGRERDPAARLYLEDALARAEGRQPPAEPPPARSVAAREGLTWACGFVPGAEASPFEAYYVLNVTVNDAWKQLYKSGKIFFGRASPIGNPGLIITDPQWRDRFWLNVDAELTPERLPYLDGVVYGEETMRFGADDLWETGWRLFCLDADIDPGTVRGEREALAEPEQRAWNNWALERCVDGFNALYDYTKRRAGKLRPGLQVATFLPGESATSREDRRWKFDVAGLYDYKGCNRIAAYTLTRRIKTLWPERPVIWLSLGIGGYEMNPVKYKQKVPSLPIQSRRDRAYADSISAWLAGADPGWFSTWIFVAHDFKGGMGNLSGVQIHVEDIFCNTNLVARGIDYAFRGVDELYDMQSLKKPEPGSSLNIGEKDDLSGFQLEEPEDEGAAIRERIAQEKARMYDGFQFYGKYVYDCARVFSDLPRLNYSAPSLLIRPGITVWTRGGRLPLVPGFALLTEFDFLMDINKVPAIDPARYRLIAAHRPGRLTDRTLASLTDWVRHTPGLLYLHPTLTSDNEAEASTAADHDGRLQNDWPWEADVVQLTPEAMVTATPAAPISLEGDSASLALEAGTVESTFALSGPRAKALLSWQGQPVLVLWQAPDTKGAVLFDGLSNVPTAYLDHLRDVMNRLHADSGIGIRHDGPALHQARVLADPPVSAACTSGYNRDAMTNQRYPGGDLLTGEPNPWVGNGRSGAIIAQSLAGTYTAAGSGVAVLSDQPLDRVETQSGDLVVSSPGLIRAGAASGAVTVSVDGRPLPVIEDIRAWLLSGTQEGQASVAVGAEEEGNRVLYVRSRQAVHFSVGAREARPQEDTTTKGNHP